MFIGFHFAWKWWSWSHQAHGTSEDVEQLGEFIQAVPTKDAAHSSNSRVILDFEKNALALVAVLKFSKPSLRIHDHRSKFEHLEVSALYADTILPKQNWPFTAHPNQKSYRAH